MAIAGDLPERGVRLMSAVTENIRTIDASEPISFGSSLVGLLRAGDDLGADALLEFAVEAATHPEAAILYCDERRYDYATKAISAFFKPDWSPDLLLATNYLGRLWSFALLYWLRSISHYHAFGR